MPTLYDLRALNQGVMPGVMQCANFNKAPVDSRSSDEEQCFQVHPDPSYGPTTYTIRLPLIRPQSFIDRISQSSFASFKQQREYCFAYVARYEELAQKNQQRSYPSDFDVDLRNLPTFSRDAIKERADTDFSAQQKEHKTVASFIPTEEALDARLRKAEDVRLQNVKPRRSAYTAPSPPHR